MLTKTISVGSIPALHFMRAGEHFLILLPASFFGILDRFAFAAQEAGWVFGERLKEGCLVVPFFGEHYSAFARLACAIPLVDAIVSGVLSPIVHFYFHKEFSTIKRKSRNSEG